MCNVLKIHNLTVSQMETSYLVVFSSVSGVLALAILITAGYLVNRLNQLREFGIRLNNELATKSQPKQIEQALATAEGSRARIDTALLELGKFKEGVHSEMQRFYAIMRRNEKAAGFVQGQQSAPGPPESEFPDVIPGSTVKKPDEEEVESRASLRERARAAGLKV